MFLGIDIGTSGVKAVVVDSAGAVAAQGTAALTVQRPHPLWSEQSPEAWWSATTAAIRSIPRDVRHGVRGIGIAGQMHGATLLDANDRPLRPAILWNDGRSHAEAEHLDAATPLFRELGGNIVMPGFTAPKLAWVRENEPQIFDAVSTVLLPKDYIRLRMTGEKASDMSDSAGTLWLDVAKRQWSPELLAACGLGVEHMPTLVEGTEQTGTLLPEIAELWDMPEVPVAGGGGDNAAGAAGIGVVRDGDALLSLGTSGVIFVANAEFRPNPASAVHAFCHCLPGLWHQMAVHLSAASCVDLAAGLLGTEGAASLFALAESAGPGSGPELFFPYLSGERTPHNDAQVRGGFLRIDNDTDRSRLAQAVLEGVAFALADGLDALRGAGTEVESLRVIGGGARSRYWGETIAAALNVELVYLRGGEVGPAMGAARLAQICVDGGTPSEICEAPPVAWRVAPDPEIADRLAPKRADFIAAYPGITPRKLS